MTKDEGLRTANKRLRTEGGGRARGKGRKRTIEN